MPITFENDNDVIVYALEKIIVYARRTQQVFVAQCVWWLASVIGLENGLIAFIDSLQSRVVVTVIPEKVPSVGGTVSPIPRDNQEDQRQDKILEECEEYLKDSKRLRDIATLKATGKTLTGFINPTAISKKHLKKKDRPTRKQAKYLADPPKNIDRAETEGIDPAELKRRREVGECLRCACPSDLKGAHRVANCRRPIKLNKGTANSPKVKEYLKAQQATLLIPGKEESSEFSSCEESSDDSL
jgi:hypothetical protein